MLAVLGLVGEKVEVVVVFVLLPVPLVLSDDIGVFPLKVGPVLTRVLRLID